MENPLSPAAEPLLLPELLNSDFVGNFFFPLDIILN